MNNLKVKETGIAMKIQISIVFIVSASIQTDEPQRRGTPIHSYAALTGTSHYNILPDDCSLF